ncbi:MAG TPA: four helix bundle protein [Chloroflexi bacterium]|nr:four helix bundle protein [Chloroflexota bacterium]
MRGEREFDIQERTFTFAVRIVKLVNRLPRTTAGFAIGRQVVRSATSIGSNVQEADAAESKRDFIHKMSIAHKEARETRYWLRIVSAALLDDDEVQALIQESDELVRILYAIVENARRSSRSKTGR